jgi:hypothetical protein
MNVSYNEILDHVVGQAVCNWLMATEPNIQSQGSPRAFCTGKRQCNYVLVSEYFIVSLSVIFP